MKQNKNNRREKVPIWNFFYENKSIIPRDEKEFINKVDTDKDYILTDGMNIFVKRKLGGSSITKTQMRTLFEEVKNANAQNLTKLRVKLIYIAGKVDSYDIKEFIQLLIDILKHNYSLGRDFIESALAYHKFYSKK